MINIKLKLDDRRIKKDRTFPLVFRITFDGDFRDIPLGHSSTKADWNTRNNSLKDSHPLYSILAPKIRDLELKYHSKIVEFEKLYPNETQIQKIKEFLINDTPNTTDQSTETVQTFWLKEIDFLHKSNRSGGARVYQDALNGVSRHRNLNLSFRNLDYNFLKELEASMIAGGMNLNGIGVYFRGLRAICNLAIKSKLIKPENYPFATFKIKKQLTTPRVITIEEIQRFFNLKIEPSSWLYESWLLGKLMFMLIGINFKDLILLKDSDIKGNRAFYIRSKTKKLYSIGLPIQAHAILDYFRWLGKETLFGKLEKTDLDNKKRLPLVIKQKNKNFNRHLRELGKQAECKEPITGYVFRYTWANIAKQMGNSKDLIAEALGHEYGNKITGIYLEAYDKELIDEMNQKIIDKVTNS